LLAGTGTGCKIPPAAGCWSHLRGFHFHHQVAWATFFWSKTCPIHPTTATHGLTKRRCKSLRCSFLPQPAHFNQQEINKRIAAINKCVVLCRFDQRATSTSFSAINKRVLSCHSSIYTTPYSLTLSRAQASRTLPWLSWLTLLRADNSFVRIAILYG
jgi:hypothetical protein